LIEFCRKYDKKFIFSGAKNDLDSPKKGKIQQSLTKKSGEISSFPQIFRAPHHLPSVAGSEG
jgi:hypothetical protein